MRIHLNEQQTMDDFKSLDCVCTPEDDCMACLEKEIDDTATELLDAKKEFEALQARQNSLTAKLDALDKPPSKEVKKYKHKFLEQQWNLFLQLPLTNSQRVHTLMLMEEEAKKATELKEAQEELERIQALPSPPKLERHDAEACDEAFTLVEDKKKKKKKNKRRGSMFPFDGCCDPPSSSIND